jgi:hypothetical protein
MAAAITLNEIFMGAGFGARSDRTNLLVALLEQFCGRVLPDVSGDARQRNTSIASTPRMRYRHYFQNASDTRCLANRKLYFVGCGELRCDLAPERQSGRACSFLSRRHGATSSKVRMLSVMLPRCPLRVVRVGFERPVEGPLSGRLRTRPALASPSSLTP